MNDQFDKLKKEVSELIENKKYDQILSKIDSFDNKKLVHSSDLKSPSEKLEFPFEKKIYKSLLDITPSGICIFTKVKFLYVNIAWLKILGYSEEEVYGMNPLDFVHPDMRKEVSQRADLRKRGEKVSQRYDMKIITKNKNTKWIDITLSLVQFENQQATLCIFNDITEIKNTRGALIKSEEKFKKLTQLSPAAICIQTTEKFLWANPAWSEISGYPNDEVLNMGPLDIVHPDMHEIVKKRSDSRLNNEDVTSRYNLKILTKDKKLKWVDIAISVIKYEGKNASLAVSSDVTEQVLARQALKESEEKYRSLIENLRFEYFFYRHNIEGYFEYVSPSIENILGYTQNEFLTHYTKYLTNRIENKLAIEKTELSLKGIQQEPYELELYDNQNNIHIIEISETPVIDANGNIIFVEGIAHDITSRKRAEEELKESKKLYEKLVNNQGEALGIVDNNNEFVFVNPVAHEIFGVPEDHLVGRNIKEFLSDEYIKKVNEQTLKRQKGVKNTYELEILRTDDTKRYILVTASPEYNEKTEIIGAFAIFRDITERKKAENIVLKSEKKLREMNAQKDKFFSLIAHDLRSPIGNFLQISELLQSNFEELSKDQIHGFFDNLHNLADRTFTLLENLLMWSRSQLGRLEIVTKEIELHNVVNEVSELYTENFNSKNIKFINEIPHNLIVKTDLNILQTVLRNLISNALKFSYPGGDITVGCNPEINKLDNSEYYIICVKDTGVGIPENKIEKIFSLDDDYTTLGTEREKGTGLGLVLCKELIEKNGGGISVESKKGKGSIFSFTLKR